MRFAVVNKRCYTPVKSKCAGGYGKRGGFVVCGDYVVFVSNGGFCGVGAYINCGRAGYIFARYGYGKP